MSNQVPMENVKEFIEKEFSEIGEAYSNVFFELRAGKISIEEAKLRNIATDKRMKLLKQKIKEIINNSNNEPEK